jgi:hypothetical protein
MEIDIEKAIDSLLETNVDEITYSMDIQRNKQKYSIEFTIKKEANENLDKTD